MANTRGGVILLGVEDDGTVSGIKDIRGLKKNFWDTINNRGKTSANILSENDLIEYPHPNGLIFAIRIPRASRYQKPVFIGQNPLTGTYRRNSEGDYHCTEQEVSRMLADRSEESADSRILDTFTLGDLDLPSLHQYRQRFASHKPTHPWLSENDEGLLNKVNGWNSCRTTGKKGLTIAGLLMFGKEEVLRTALPQYHVDFREKLSENLEIRWTDRLVLDGTWPGNLFQFYVRVVQRLAADVKLPFQLDSDLFRKGETVVHVAIREALVNALIHADYQGQGGIVIEKYRDRFEFSNPGTLLISLDQLFHGNISECRNKSLQTMFTLIGAAERAGSGVDKIRMGWSSQHWRSPMVREQMQPDRVIWKLPMVSLIPSESLEKLKKRLGSKYSKFNQLEIQSLVTADIEGYVDNSRMRQITNKHPADITKLLQGLVSQEVLIQDGQGRWTRYYLPTEPDSVHKNSNSVHKNSNSVHKNSNSAHKIEVLGDEWAALLLMAEPARQNRRLVPGEMEKVILNLCQSRWLTRKQLGDLVKRNPDGLRSRFLTQMIGHGLLQLLHPDKPNRKDQAYTSSDSAAKKTKNLSN
jgi:ATP-dependent DNA helicase RecG